MHYYDSDDLKRLGEFKQLAPTEFSAFVEFDKIVGREDGTIPRKYRELIAIAVACTTQCPYCLDVHTRAAKRAGATREEVTEGAMLAAALRAGAAVTHGCTRGEVVRPGLSVPSGRCRHSQIRRARLRPPRLVAKCDFTRSSFLLPCPPPIAARCLGPSPASSPAPPPQAPHPRRLQLLQHPREPPRVQYPR